MLFNVILYTNRTFIMDRAGLFDHGNKNIVIVKGAEKRLILKQSLREIPEMDDKTLKFSTASVKSLLIVVFRNFDASINYLCNIIHCNIIYFFHFSIEPCALIILISMTDPFV